LVLKEGDVLGEVPGAGGGEVRALRAQIEQLERDLETLRNNLEAERSRSFWGKVFGRPATEPVEGMRERIRGRIAMALIVTLIFVMLATLGYLVWLSLNLTQVSSDDLNTVIPMVGTTLLTPLVGLIGAVTGFYYGGQQALQAASEASQAAQATQAATQAVTPAATQAVVEAVTPAAAQVAAQAATRAATQAASQQVPPEEEAPEEEAPEEEAPEEPPQGQPRDR
jgi:hypothetical protein